MMAVTQRFISPEQFSIYALAKCMLVAFIIDLSVNGAITTVLLGSSTLR